MTPPAASDLRRRLLELVQEYPGLHVRDLSRRLDTPVRLVEYHAAALLDAGLLRDRRQGAYQRLYPVGDSAVQPGDERVLGLLRKEVPLGIALELIEVPEGLRHADLCERLASSKSNISHHLNDLERAGIIGKRAGVIRLRDPERIRRLLQQNKPTPDLVSRFANAWSLFYKR
ncbi:MAG: ArsR family transcriptional regulator [Thermoplasmatota archaeon]